MGPAWFQGRGCGAARLRFRSQWLCQGRSIAAMIMSARYRSRHEAACWPCCVHCRQASGLRMEAWHTARWLPDWRLLQCRPVVLTSAISYTVPSCSASTPGTGWNRLRMKAQASATPTPAAEACLAADVTQQQGIALQHARKHAAEASMARSRGRPAAVCLKRRPATQSSLAHPRPGSQRRWQ